MVPYPPVDPTPSPRPVGTQEKILRSRPVPRGLHPFFFEVPEEHPRDHSITYVYKHTRIHTRHPRTVRSGYVSTCPHTCVETCECRPARRRLSYVSSTPLLLSREPHICLGAYGPKWNPRGTVHDKGCFHQPYSPSLPSGRTPSTDHLLWCYYFRPRTRSPAPTSHPLGVVLILWRPPRPKNLGRLGSGNVPTFEIKSISVSGYSSRPLLLNLVREGVFGPEGHNFPNHPG